MSEPNTRSQFAELESGLSRSMVAFGERVRSRRPDIRYTVSQPPSIHYASSTLLGFNSAAIEDDLVVAGATLDIRSGSPVWSIDIITGQGMPIAERALAPDVAAAMAQDPERARQEVEAFLDTNFDAVIAALSHVTFSDAD